MEKQQSSILTPNNKLVGVKTSKKEEPKLPKPTGWRMLVLPFKMKETTKGGIDNMEKYRYIIGQITALEAVKQELSSLLEDKEQNEKGTVINLNTKQ